MKENSIEEDIETIKYNMKIIKNVMNNFEDELCENMQMKTDEVNKAIEHVLSDYKRVLKENEKFRNFLEKIIREYIPDYELEQLIDRYKNESFIPRVEVKKILEDRRK